MTKVEVSSGVDTMPSSITELEPLVKEFIEKLKTIQHEQELLKEDEKALVEEYKEKLDMPTLKAVMRTLAIKEKVKHKDTFDTFEEILERV